MHICLPIAWWHFHTPEKKKRYISSTSLHEMCPILQNAEQQQTGRESVGLGYSAVLGDAINFTDPNPTGTTISA